MSKDTPKDKAVSNGNESAFPAGNYAKYQKGMTKRELIAKDLMAGIVSRNNSPAPDWAKCAADALLEALNAQ